MKRTQKNALAMAGLMTAATLFSAVPAMADDVITVDFGQHRSRCSIITGKKRLRHLMKPKLR